MHMDQKRFLLFIVLSMGLLIGSNSFVVPWMGWGPRPPKKPAQNEVARRDHPDEGDEVVARPEKLDAEVGPAADDSPADEQVAADAPRKAAERPATDDVPERATEPAEPQ